MTSNGLVYAESELGRARRIWVPLEKNEVAGLVTVLSLRWSVLSTLLHQLRLKSRRLALNMS